ncbi:hypothetical protein KR222_001900 [Zaprionus bogoriensis]|nr:hypothetical protein KR222_001900 [Zaprionus bogoriensis]
MKIAIEGCAHGELEHIYETIENIEKERNIKINLLLCCGDFQSTRNVMDLQTMAVPRKYMDMCTFYKYYSGERVAPILTIFIGGNHEASNYLQELPYGGWVAPNIYYLGYAGVVNVNGVRIAGISGIYKGHDFLRGHHEFPPYSEKTCRSVYHVRQLEVFRLKQLSGKVDIFMSHDWPRGIHEYGNKTQLLRFKPHFAADIESGQLGSRPLEELLKAVQPTYWFAAHLHCKFAALVPHNRSSRKSPNADSSSSSEDSETEDELNSSAKLAPVPVTKFLALDKCLPKRRFLQVLDIPAKVNDGAKIRMEYDEEWLSILLSTNHLTSIKDSNYFLPGKQRNSAAERCDFRPTPEEKDHIRSKFPSLTVPENFRRTVPAFDPEEEQNYKQAYVEQPNAQLNPQNNEFCTILGIDDPLCLAMLADGKDLPPIGTMTNIGSPNLVKNDSISCSNSFQTPSKRKLNLSLPAPSAKDAGNDGSIIELPPEMHDPEAKEDSLVDVDEHVKLNGKNTSALASPTLKKLKRRNQSIYQAEDTAEGEAVE